MNGRFNRVIIALLLVGALAPALAACGKKGSPSAPGPQDKITYPAQYPPPD